MLLKRKMHMAILLTGLMLIWATAVSAQQPRPTPTNIAPNRGTSQGERKGSIQGAVYEDTNGDGNCVNTGVEGEGPVEGVTLQFVSSDAATIIDLTSGPEGFYGLFAAGQSYWGVTALPGSEWVVSSEPTIYVPVYEADGLNHTDINFCVRKATAADQITLLPEAGGARTNSSSGIFMVATLMGLLLIVGGLGLYWRENQVKQ